MGEIKQIVDVLHEAWDKEPELLEELGLGKMFDIYKSTLDKADIDKPVVFVSYSVKEVLEMLETYELSLDMTEAEIHTALVYAAERGYEFSDETDLIQSIQDAHKVLTTH